MLAHQLTFSPEQDESFFQQLPTAAAVFLLRGDGEPYISKTANLRRRLLRLLAPPTEFSKRLNLRERVREIEFTLTGSDFESQFLLYRVLREAFPKTYAARLRLRPAPLVKLHLENEYPRASVTTRLGRITAHTDRTSGAKAEISETTNGTTEVVTSHIGTGEGAQGPRKNLYYGPFLSRTAAEKFASDALDFFKMRRCVEDLHPDPAFPGCVYSEMKMCLAPCFKGCTDDEYQSEVARVEAFFDSSGASLINEFAQQRDEASVELAFEEAAALHAKLDKLKPMLSQLPEIVHRIDRLKALIIQPAASHCTTPGGDTPDSADGIAAQTFESVSLFLFQDCVLRGPVEFSIAPHAQSRSMESRVEEALRMFVRTSVAATSERTEHLAMLKRWYYRSTRVGEIFFEDEKSGWPFRRIVRGIGRVARGEKEPQVPQPTAPAP